MRWSKTWVAIAAVYGLILLGLAIGLGRARTWAMSDLSTTAAQAEWSEFRDDVATQAGQGGPVRRQIPESVEPPALVLLRDHFLICAVTTTILVSTLYGTLAFFLVGALQTPTPTYESRGRPDRPHRDSNSDV